MKEDSKNKAELGGGGRNASSEGPKTWPSGPERPEKEMSDGSPSRLYLKSKTKIFPFRELVSGNATVVLLNSPEYRPDAYTNGTLFSKLINFFTSFLFRILNKYENIFGCFSRINRATDIVA